MSQPDTRRTKAELIQELQALRRQLATEDVATQHRQETENTLRKNAEWFRTAADNESEWQSWLDREGRPIYVSPACQRITGHPPEAFLADPGLLQRLAHPEDSDAVARHLPSDTLSRPKAAWEFRIMLATGESRWIEHRGHPVYDAAGRFLGRREVYRDITQRKQAENQRRETDSQYQALLAACPDAVVMTDLQGRVLFASGPARDLLGLAGTEEELVGQSLFAYVREEDRGRLAGHLAEVLKIGTRRNTAYEALRQNGTTVPMEVSSSVIRDAAGHPRAWVAILRNIADRKHADALIRSQSLFPEEDPAPVLRIGRAGTLLYANQAATTLLDQWRCRVGGDVPQDVQHTTAAVLQTGKSQEMAARCGERDLSFIVVPIFEQDYVNLYGRDCTEQKRVTQALRASEEQYRGLFEAESDALVLMDCTTQLVLDVNDAAVRLYGYSRHEWFNLNAADISAEPDQPQDSIAAGPVRIPLSWHRKKDGTVFPVEISGSAFEYQGRMVQVAAIRDNTHRYQAEEALRQSEERLSLVMDAAELGTWDWNLISGELTWSPSCYTLFGVRPGTPLHYERFLQAVYPEDRQGVARALREAMLHGAEYNQELRVLWPDGSLHWLLLRGRAGRNAAGRVVRMIGAVLDTTRTQLANELLRQSEERLRLAQDAGRVGAWDWNISANRLAWLGNLKAMYGLPVDGKLTRIEDFFARIHPDDLASVERARDRAFQEGLAYATEFRVIWPDGSVHWLLGRGSLIRDARGQPSRMVGINVDITPQKEAAEVLRHSEEQAQAETARWQALMDAVPALVWVAHDRDCQTVFGNRLAHNFLRVPVGTNLSKTGPDAKRLQHYRIFQDGREVPSADLPIQRAAATGQEQRDCKLEYVFADGTRRSLRGNVAPLVDVHGQPRGAISAYLDVTEQKQAEAVIRESEERYRSLFDRTPDAVYRSTPEGRYLDVNPAMVKLFGYASKEEMLLVDIPTEIYFAPEERQQIFQQGGIQVFRQRRKDGSEIWVEDHAEYVRDVQGTVMYHEGVMRDISERKRLDEALQQALQTADAANRAKSQFLTNMSHEIRTPLTAILGFADLLAGEDLPTIERQRYSSLIQRNGRLLLTIIDDLLDLAKIEAGKLHLQFVDVRPCEILEDIHALTLLAAQQKDLELRVRYDYPLPETIRTDATRLRQILLNLVSNAIKFTDQGQILMHLAGHQACGGAWEVCFSVTDTGMGISPQGLSQIFQPLTQLDPSMDRAHGGAGLGLTISRRLAEMLGGQITVESEPGRGSTFTLTLRLNSVGKLLLQPPTQPAESTPQAVVRRERLLGRGLVAEDSPDSRLLLQRLLTAAGAEVDLARNGREAWEMAQLSLAVDRPYDFILMDMQMPVLNGYKATAQLRQAGWSGPIIAVTAHALVSDRQACLDCGCSDYLAKPVDFEQLAAVLKQYLKTLPAVTQESRTTESRPDSPTPALDPQSIIQEFRTSRFPEFRAGLQQHVALLQERLAARDVEGLILETHRLAGSAALFDYPQLHNSAQFVEAALRQGVDLELVSQPVRHLLELCRHVLELRPEVLRQHEGP